MTLVSPENHIYFEVENHFLKFQRCISEANTEICDILNAKPSAAPKSFLNRVIRHIHQDCKALLKFILLVDAGLFLGSNPFFTCNQLLCDPQALFTQCTILPLFAVCPDLEMVRAE